MVSQSAVREWCMEFQSCSIHGDTDRNTVTLNASKRVDNAPNFSGILMVSLTKMYPPSNFDWWIQFDYTLFRFFSSYWLNFGYEIIKMSFPIVAIIGQFDQQNAHFRILKSFAFFFTGALQSRNALIVCVLMRSRNFVWVIDAKQRNLVEHCRFMIA